MFREIDLEAVRRLVAIAIIPPPTAHGIQATHQHQQTQPDDQDINPEYPVNRNPGMKKIPQTMSVRKLIHFPNT